MREKRFQIFETGFELSQLVLNGPEVSLPGIHQGYLQKKPAGLRMERAALAHERIDRRIGIGNCFHIRITFGRGRWFRGAYLPIILLPSAENWNTSLNSGTLPLSLFPL